MIRRATLDDLPALMRLGADMHAESPRFSRWRLNEGKLARLFERMLGDQDAFLWVAEHEGRVAGLLAAMIFDHWCVDQRMAMDFGLFMEPARRGGLHAARLVKEYKAWAAEAGAHCEMGATTGVAPEATDRFLRCMGLRPCGALYEAI
jgi:GNAT superfamily N-acetyltransferase